MILLDLVIPVIVKFMDDTRQLAKYQELYYYDRSSSRYCGKSLQLIIREGVILLARPYPLG